MRPPFGVSGFPAENPVPGFSLANAFGDGDMAPADFQPRRFDLGRIRVTPAAAEVLRGSRQLAAEFLARHVLGDYGDVGLKDRLLNDRAHFLAAGILSSYATRSGNRLYVITEADRSATTVMLPSEY